jgi:diguanylate cyclase (GGDEF)-like protein
LAWWGAAYVIGGLSGAIWRLGDLVTPPLPVCTPSVLLFVAVGMIWSASRLFHGRPIRWGSMFLGATVWIAATNVPAFIESATWRVMLSSLIVATYTFLIASELWRERRKSLIQRWPAIFVPILHGGIFLLPMTLSRLSVDLRGAHGLATGWAAVFAIEVVLYVVGAAFIVLVLAKDRTVRLYKTAALTDPLTSVLNRRGFYEGAAAIMNRNKGRMAPVSVLAFDLDHFKSINDRFGHKVGDTALVLFASVVRKTMRADDVIGRLGGEEFIALVSGNLAEAGIAAERVRSAFEAARFDAGGKESQATVSVGVACGAPTASIDTLIARADAALYGAKSNGRNRVEFAEEPVAGVAVADAGHVAGVQLRGRAAAQPVPVLAG